MELRLRREDTDHNPDSFGEWLAAAINRPPSPTQCRDKLLAGSVEELTDDSLAPSGPQHK